MDPMGMVCAFTFKLRFLYFKMCFLDFVDVLLFKMIFCQCATTSHSNLNSLSQHDQTTKHFQVKKWLVVSILHLTKLWWNTMVLHNVDYHQVHSKMVDRITCGEDSWANYCYTPLRKVFWGKNNFHPQGLRSGRWSAFEAHEKSVIFPPVWKTK